MRSFKKLDIIVKCLVFVFFCLVCHVLFNFKIMVTSKSFHAKANTLKILVALASRKNSQFPTKPQRGETQKTRKLLMVVFLSWKPEKTLSKISQTEKITNYQSLSQIT